VNKLGNVRVPYSGVHLLCRFFLKFFHYHQFLLSYAPVGAFEKGFIFSFA
jgi:hypothetical protein